jgi:glycerophosphoryl diester phosphodiesterase
MTSNFLRRFLLPLLALAVLATACGGGSDDESASDPDPTEVPAAPATEVPEPTVAPAPPATEVPEPTATPEPTPTPEPVRPTIDELISSGKILNIAHAGGDQENPHSTRYAFDQAVANGADILELDVQLTADGVLIIQHDSTVDRTTEATGPVSDRTLSELKALDAGYRFAEGCWSCPDRPDEEYIYRGVRTGDIAPPEGASPDDFTIQTFAEIVERFPLAAFDIEIKGDFPEALDVAEQLALEIDEFGLTENVVVVSFDDEIVAAFGEMAPDVERSPGTGAMTSWLLAGTDLDEGMRIVQVPPFFGAIEVINPAFWARVEATDVTVWMWPNDGSTQENTEFYQEMIDQGVTGIIAGRPSQVPS